MRCSRGDDSDRAPAHPELITEDGELDEEQLVRICETMRKAYTEENE